jgi:hypothetical protein
LRERLAVDGEANGVVAGLQAGLRAHAIASLAWLRILSSSAGGVTSVDRWRRSGAAEASSASEAACGTDVE